jgi:hypothetical protein
MLKLVNKDLLLVRVWHRDELTPLSLAYEESLFMTTLTSKSC